MRLAEIGNPKIRSLYGFWEERRRDDGLPMARSILDPVMLGPLLANTMLLEVLDSGDGGQRADLRIRLAGDEIERRYGRSLRGASLYETFPMVLRRDTSHQWSAILRDQRPKYRCGPMRFPNERVFEAERVIFPLSEGENPVAYILGAIFYLPLGEQEMTRTTVVGDLEP